MDPSRRSSRPPASELVLPASRLIPVAPAGEQGRSGLRPLRPARAEAPVLSDTDCSLGSIPRVGRYAPRIHWVLYQDAPGTPTLLTHAGPAPTAGGRCHRVRAGRANHARTERPPLRHQPRAESERRLQVLESEIDGMKRVGDAGVRAPSLKWIEARLGAFRAVMAARAVESAELLRRLLGTITLGPVHPADGAPYYVARTALDVLVLLDPEGPGPGPDPGARSLRWWTRNERTRTVAVLSLEEVLRDPVPPPAYQRLASAAADLRLKGWSDQSIAVEFGVTGKTIAKAIRWLRAWMPASTLAGLPGWSLARSRRSDGARFVPGPRRNDEELVRRFAAGSVPDHGEATPGVTAGVIPPRDRVGRGVGRCTRAAPASARLRTPELP